MSIPSGKKILKLVKIISTSLHFITSKMMIIRIIIGGLKEFSRKYLS